ncbi:MotA/TolQ/ExbB proton channel family protein [Erythrobacter sp. SCSIO 43205]|uniref:MotA/TolQ/ExbB proton channel family protein n=1 Tax=Erythrobacter sp. SCSIO 43205 TaxID=2779361 RepID=UPI001CAA1926|nr:MotA/TolQ/ExbB proton channel family protein [Erythrobacter sp. SCSIO 43205]UAB78720.1 MotA/TolQ/ExbB proton channel family protein [Erythrobacter sp. SCSIO 43205]
MLEPFTKLLDANALVIVLVGTVLATLARQGWHDFTIAVPAAFGLLSKGFDVDATRAALARTVGEINRLGHLGAEPVDPPDKATTELLNAYIRTGSIEAMLKLARSQRLQREINSVAATRVFENAGELAPVFGLVGTLFAITQLVPDVSASAAETVMGSVAGAVLSTLYGVLSAHLIFYPLARAIERKGDREETERTMLLDWFESELTDGRSFPSRARRSSVTPVKDVA